MQLASPFIGEHRSVILQPAGGQNMKPIPTTICLGLLALCAISNAAEKPMPYRAPRLPDGHVDIQGIWKNSNLTPLERPPGFTTLVITAADAARLKTQYLTGPSVANQPDDPGKAIEDRNFERIRDELRSSQIIDPEDGRIPWNEVYKEKVAALRRTFDNGFDNPEQRPVFERCLGSIGAPPMQPKLDNNLYQFVQTPAITVILSEFINDARMIQTREWDPLARCSHLVAWRFGRLVGARHARRRNEVFCAQQCYSHEWSQCFLRLASDDRD